MQIPKEFITQLKQSLGDTCVLTDPVACFSYSYDNSRRCAPPDVVAFVTQHEQVLAVIQLCHQFQVPIVARGRGSGTPGGSVPLQGGLVLSFERMNRILQIDPDNRVMVVEPGVTNQEVQEAAAKVGFFWPPDPSSAAFCTVGGNLAYNSAGPRAVKYGTPRENTLGLRAVTGTGQEIRTGVYTTKGVVGYDLTRLLIGSEGTLAVITKATLKLTPLPETKRTFQAIYRDIHSAAAAVSRIMAQPMTPCALEFIDSQSIGLIRGYSSLEIPAAAGALLIIEVDGAESAMEAAVAAITLAAQNAGLMQLVVAQNEAQRKILWDARKELSPALRTLAPKKINEDVVVPVSYLPDLIEGLEALAKQYHILIVNFGHAGNGNIHVNLMIDPADPIQAKAAQHCLSDVFDLVLKLKGTLSGEHGIGIEKRDYITREIDPNSLQLMRNIKQLFDPSNILNPGKIFPPGGSITKSPLCHS